MPRTTAGVGLLPARMRQSLQFKHEQIKMLLEVSMDASWES